jgi:prepilin-type N-terminal cleavage/methylation domain-containing protein
MNLLSSPCQSDWSYTFKLPYLSPIHLLFLRYLGAASPCTYDGIHWVSQLAFIGLPSSTQDIRVWRNLESSKRKKGRMLQRRMRGFSLLEMMAVIAIGLIISVMAGVALQPTLKYSRETNAYNITLMAMRQARDTAVAQRQVYFVTFTHNATPPDQITITQGGTGTVMNTFTLPNDVSFQVEVGFPGAGATPDGFGSGGTAIDFDQGVAGGVQNVVYFYPDGTSEDVNGNMNNGVIYIARTNDLFSAHAITVWGATGRLRGWRLYNNAGTKYWRQM